MFEKIAFIRPLLFTCACLFLTGFGGPAQATPELRCLVTYAGETQVLIAHPTQHPYEVEATEIGDRFALKLVLRGQGYLLDSVHIYAYLLQEPRAVMIQSIKYLAPFRRTAKPYLLTGEQHVYAGAFERELMYRCELGGLKP